MLSSEQMQDQFTSR